MTKAPVYSYGNPAEQADALPAASIATAWRLFAPGRTPTTNLARRSRPRSPSRPRCRCSPLSCRRRRSSRPRRSRAPAGWDRWPGRPRRRRDRRRRGRRRVLDVGDGRRARRRLAVDRGGRGEDGGRVVRDVDRDAGAEFGGRPGRDRRAAAARPRVDPHGRAPEGAAAHADVVLVGRPRWGHTGDRRSRRRDRVGELRHALARVLGDVQLADRRDVEAPRLVDLAALRSGRAGPAMSRPSQTAKTPGCRSSTSFPNMKRNAPVLVKTWIRSSKRSLT